MSTEGRMAEATYNGRAYRIPDIWLAGATHHGATILEAVAHWAWQTELAERDTALDSSTA